MNRKDNNILIVEDEFINSEFLKQVLYSIGFEKIHIVTNSDDAVNVTKNRKIDLIFMDININGAIDGIMCAKIINEKNDIPIVYTTAYADSNTINEASETNLYGYLIKPFDSKDVEVTCNIVEKMTSRKDVIEKEENTVQVTSSCKYDLQSKTLFIDNITIKLSKNELKLLDILCRNINQCVTYEMIKDFVWEDKTIADSTMRDTISRLRRKTRELEIDSFSGIGYCLKKA